MKRGWIIALVAIAWSGAAQADEASDRRRAMSDAERLVGDMASALSGLAGSSSARGIDSAISKGDRLKSKLRDLDRVKGSDSKARNMVSRWPRYVDKLKDVRRPLQTLKKHQRALKKAADTCKRHERDLERLIEGEIRKDGPNSARAIQDAAKRLGRDASGAVRKGDDQRRDMERAKSDARRFDASDGRWRDVRSRIQSAADRMYGDWRRDYDKVKRACDALSKGDRHPAVRKGLENLKRVAQKRSDLMKRAEGDLKAIVSKSKGLDGARDAGPITQVGRALDDLKRRVRELDRVKGGDPKAKEMASRWPGTAAGLAQGLSTLKTMKQQQFALKGRAAACTDTEKRLLAQAKAAAATPEAGTRKALQADAQRIGSETRKALDAAKKQRDGLKRAKDQLGRLKGDGPWRAVVGNLRDGGAKMLAQYERDFGSTESACGKLAQGVKHPGVAKALDDIAKVLERVDRLFKTLSGEVKSLASQVKSAGGARDAGPADRAQATATGIRKQLDALKRDPDPRAQARSQAWLKHFGDLDTSLKGLKALKSQTGALAAPLKACQDLEKRLASDAKGVQTTPQLATLEKAAAPAGKTAAGHLKAADALVSQMSKAHGDATRFRFGEGEWGAVKAALKGSADAALGAFQKDHRALKAACAEVAKGAQHGTLVKTRAALDKRLAQAKKAMDTARKGAQQRCSGIKALFVKRAKRMSALKHFVDQVNTHQKLDTKPSLLKSLKEGIERAEKEIAAASKSCAGAMAAHAKADTAWEALQGR